MDIIANFAKRRCCRGRGEMTGMVWAVLATVLLVQVAQCTPSGTCVKTDSCSCKFSDGSVISLSTLANPAGDAPRFNFTQGGDYLYAYNPCNSFTYKTCVGVAACQMSTNGKEIFDVGNQDTASFKTDGTAITYTAITGSTLRTTTVNLHCDQSVTDPVFTVTGEETPGSSKYVFEITSKCACANGCIGGGGLSGGSVLCILFSVLVILYLVVGVLFLKFVRGAEGKELIPNYEFWKDLPLLIKDGVLFIAGGCKSDTNYEQI